MTKKVLIAKIPLKVPRTAYAARQETIAATAVAKIGPSADPVEPKIPWIAIPFVNFVTLCEISVNPAG